MIKVKIIFMLSNCNEQINTTTNIVNDFQEKINKFCANKEIISIDFKIPENNMACFIVYKEGA